MKNKDFYLLKVWILSKNKYFQHGFANMHYEAISGRLRSTEGDEDIAAGVDDRYGNYFYIRHTGGVQYRRSSEAQVSACRYAQEIYTSCTLVAVVTDAKPADLHLCLLNSLLRYAGADIKPVRGLIVREEVVRKEYPTMKKAGLEAILQNLGNKQLVSIDFDLSLTFQPTGDECPCTPCKTC